MGYNNRLASFKEWPYKYPSAEYLALIGFKLTAPHGIIGCGCGFTSTDFIFREWTRRDGSAQYDSDSEGEELFSVPMRVIENPSEYEPLERTHLEQVAELMDMRIAHLKGNPMCKYARLVSKKQFSQRYMDRLKTFTGYWASKISIRRLAEAGFSLVGPTTVQCGYCKLTVIGWNNTVDPDVYHHEKSPGCLYYNHTYPTDLITFGTKYRCDVCLSTQHRNDCPVGNSLLYIPSFFSFESRVDTFRGVELRFNMFQGTNRPEGIVLTKSNHILPEMIQFAHQGGFQWDGGLHKLDRIDNDIGEVMMGPSLKIRSNECKGNCDCVHCYPTQF